ncbi:MAG: ParB/RepB/Spo0J family partition protein [Planctomycetes bacterium]|nr:ParB/RepB/Spo0J family partition protein [Planctomycetota bacterium]
MDAHASQRDVDKSNFRRRLGRGLNALLGGGHDESPLDAEAAHLAETPAAAVPTLQPAAAATEDPPVHDEAAPVSSVPVDAIDRNPYQPRRDFEPEAIRELADSIRKHGLLQPILVRAFGERFQLIAGERRWLASREVGLDRIPCRILALEDREVCEVAIEENLKRRDLNILEKAQAFKDYLDRFQSTIEELAGRLSMSRSALSNSLRLLELSAPVKEALAAGRISAGHARALLPLEAAAQRELCERIERESLTVRQTEQAVRDLQAAPEPTADDAEAADAPDVVPFTRPAQKQSPQLTAHVQSLVDQLRSLLGAKVEIQLRGKDSGRIIIPFDSNDDFERLLHGLRRAA